MIAIIGGTSLLDTASFTEWADVTVSTRFGTVVLKTSDNGRISAAPRQSLPASAQDQPRANIAALKRTGSAEDTRSKFSGQPQSSNQTGDSYDS